MRPNSFAFFLGGITLVVSQLPPLPAFSSEGAGCLPTLDDVQAWSRLPPLADGERQSLPAWARLLADSLPRTTAAMLELDALHRAHSPLGAVLAAKTRGEVARANRCAYSIALAEDDLRRPEAGHFEPTPATGDSPGLPDRERGQERLVLAFARRLTLEADTITDEDMARLIGVLGEGKLVGLVLLLAHANSQDRLFSALGAVADLGEPLPPLAGRFAKVGEDDGIVVPERILPETTTAPAVPECVDDPEWRSLDFATLQRNLETQRLRAGRIRVPKWDEVVNTIPEDQRPKHPMRILWTLVCRGYQPELAAGWSACTRIFAEEAKQDRVFEQSLFWVITRTIHCFY